MAYRNVNWRSNNSSDPYKWEVRDTWDRHNEPTMSLIDKWASLPHPYGDSNVADACSARCCRSSLNVAFVDDAVYHALIDAPLLCFLSDHGHDDHGDCGAETSHSLLSVLYSVEPSDIALAVVVALAVAENAAVVETACEQRELLIGVV